MNLGSFTFLPGASLGIDIGTSSIKVVEISQWGGRRRLRNYGELRTSTLYQKPFRTFEKNALLLSSQDIARAVRAILQEAGIKEKKAAFSLPDFSSFFTNFQLPPMTKEEVPEAVQFEARKHIPIPIGEVTFDWQVLKGRPGQNEPLDVLMVAVPKEVMNQYQEIAQLVGVEMTTLEAEAFGLMRSSVNREAKGSLILLDVGAQSTTVNVIRNGMLRSSHSFDTAGNSFTTRISSGLSINRELAEEQKKEKGIVDSLNQRDILSPLIDLMIVEVQKASQGLKEQGGAVDSIVIGGGTSLLPGFREYFEKNLQMAVELADPFRRLFYPPILEPTLKEMGPSFAVAVGMALRDFE